VERKRKKTSGGEWRAALFLSQEQLLFFRNTRKKKKKEVVCTLSAKPKENFHKIKYFEISNIKQKFIFIKNVKNIFFFFLLFWQVTISLENAGNNFFFLNIPPAFILSRFISSFAYFVIDQRNYIFVF
jgi:hypothetical protein